MAISNLNKRIPRSLLFCPVNNLKHIQHLLSLKQLYIPDGIILDLEDSIADSCKDIARRQLYSIYTNKKLNLKDKFQVFVRINAHDTKYFYDDLKVLKELGITNVVSSKIENEQELLPIRASLNPRTIMVNIETIKGYKNRDSIFKTLAKTDSIVIGYEDMRSQLCIERPKLTQQNTLSHILMECIISAKHFKIPFYDSVYTNLTDLDDFMQECIYTRGLSLTGKLAIHPDQVRIINEIFDKTKEIEYAQNIVSEYEKDSSKAIVRINDKMVGPPEYNKRCKQILSVYS